MRAIGREGRIVLDKVIVLKCGGSALDDLSTSFFENIQFLQAAGLQPVIVHGGGPAIQHMLDRLDIASEFVDGLRKTTPEMMEIVEMVLVGHVNPALTRKMNQLGLNALGVSGTDLHLLEAKPIDLDKYGLVGEIVNVNTKWLKQLFQSGVVPVISPIGIGKDNQIYNINADTAAGAIASALGAEQLVFVTDVPGILKDGKLLEVVTTSEVEKLIEDGTIYGGMIPKVKAALHGIYGNVKQVMIVNGKDSELKDQTTLKGTTIKVDSTVHV